MGGPASVAEPAIPHDGRNARWIPATPQAWGPVPAHLAAPAQTPADPEPQVKVGANPGLGHAPGEWINQRYRLVRHLGNGALTQTWEATHVELNRAVALKFIAAPAGPSRAEIYEQLLGEARAVAAIRHPHVAELSDVGRCADGQPFFVMELLAGRTLAQILVERNTLPWARAVAIAKQTAEALTAGHRRGIVHRDLRPENVFCVETGAIGDFVKVVDFGLARANTGDVGAQYMSPEQCRGEALDPRSDVYAMGCLLFTMITGDPPFVGEVHAVMELHINGQPKFLSAKAPRQFISEELEAVVARCLAKAPEHRFSDTRELSIELGRIAQGAAAASIAGAPIIREALAVAGPATPMGYAGRPAPRDARELTSGYEPIAVDPVRAAEAAAKAKAAIQPAARVSGRTSPLLIVGLSLVVAALVCVAGLGIYALVTASDARPEDPETDPETETPAGSVDPALASPGAAAAAGDPKSESPDADPSESPDADPSESSDADPSENPSGDVEIGAVTAGEPEAEDSAPEPRPRSAAKPADSKPDPEPDPEPEQGPGDLDPDPPETEPSKPTSSPDSKAKGGINHADLVDPWG